MYSLIHMLVVNYCVDRINKLYVKIEFCKKKGSLGIPPKATYVRACVGGEWMDGVITKPYVTFGGKKILLTTDLFLIKK